MVKEIIQYKCEICGREYDFKKNAIECEAKGVPELYPIGMIFDMGHKGMVFAVIKQWPNGEYGHHHAYSTWACRDTPAGDNCGDK